MDFTIQSCYNHKEPEPNTTRLGELISGTKIGVEVEVEDMIDAPSVPGWRCIPDGSLRNNGVEYVFNGPIGGAGAVSRLSKLEDALEDQGSFGFRTSVHVHVDARDMLWSKVCDLVTLYAMVEPYLFSICGQEREESIYSLSLYRGQNQISNLLHIFQEGPDRLKYRSWEKYSAINLMSLVDRGAIEFRGHEGTCDKDKLVNWINHLLCLKEFVLDPNKSISEIPTLLSTQGSKAMLRYVFGNLVRENKIHATDSSMKIFQGVWVAEELLFNSRIREVHDLIVSHNQGSRQLSKIKDKLCVD